MRPLARSFTSLGLALALLGGVGCSKAAEKLAEKGTEKAIESQTGGDAKVDIGDDGKVEIQTEDGRYSASTGEVPKSWPKDVPFPKGMKVLTGTEIGTGTEQLVSVGGATDLSPKEVVAFYEDGLDGWEAANSYNSSSDGSILQSVTFTKDDRMIQLAATRSPDDDATNISISQSVSAG